MKRAALYFILIGLVFSCSEPSDKSYQKLLENLRQKTKVVELASEDGNSRLIVSPFHQGKILASTNTGLNGDYIGWINTDAAEYISEAKDIGGEERLWIGPLGSQFSLYFQQIEPIHDDNWKVPDAIGSEPYNLVFNDEHQVELSKKVHLTNFIGTKFNIEINRKITLLSGIQIDKYLGIILNSTTDYVAFETKHKLTNRDTVSWAKETGLLSLWSAGMYQGDDSVVIIPLKNSGKRSDILTYLAPIDSTRLTVRNNMVLFKADGQYRSKIGIPPEFAPNIYGCYSKRKNRLTIIQYKKEEDSLYSNSFVSILDAPFRGEAIPIYNNGKDFFELESNAPLKVLKPNETTTHWHRVYHFSDDETALNKISETLLSTNLRDCNLIL